MLVPCTEIHAPGEGFQSRLKKSRRIRGAAYTPAVEKSKLHAAQAPFSRGIQLLREDARFPAFDMRDHV